MCKSSSCPHSIELESRLQLQQMEEAELQQREANQTALAAIGPRKKRMPEQPESQVSLSHTHTLSKEGGTAGRVCVCAFQAAVLPRPGLSQLTRVSLRELLLVLELEPLLRCSLLLYKAML